jgi:riboflavin synthase
MEDLVIACKWFGSSARDKGCIRGSDIGSILAEVLTCTGDIIANKHYKCTWLAIFKEKPSRTPP